MLRRTTLYPIFGTLLLSLLLLPTALEAQPVVDQDGDVAIGSLAPDATALLDLVSTNGGFLVPRMTEAQRDLIGLPGTPAEALMIFNTTTGEFNYWDANTGQWEVFITSANIHKYAWVLEGNNIDDAADPARRDEYNGATGAMVGTTGADDASIVTVQNQNIDFWTNNTQRFSIEGADGDIVPTNDNDIDLGSDDNRFAEVFVNGASVHIGPSGGDAGNDEMELGYSGGVGTVDVDAGGVDDLPEIVINGAADQLALDANGDGTPEVNIDGAGGFIDMDADSDGTLEVQVSANLTDIDTDLEVDADGTGTNNFTVDGTTVDVDAEGDGNLEAQITATNADFDVILEVDADDDGDNEAEIDATTADIDVILEVDADNDGTENLVVNGTTLDVDADDDGTLEVQVSANLTDIDTDLEVDAGGTGTNNLTVNAAGVTADPDGDGDTDFIAESANNGRVQIGDAGDEEELRVNGVVNPPVGGPAIPTWDVVIDGDMELTGTLGLTGYTPGSVTFIGPTNILAQDNPNFFYDDPNDALLLGATALPGANTDARLYVAPGANAATGGVGGSTLAGDPGVWDVIVDGDQVVTGIGKFGTSIWIDGTSPLHTIAADAPLEVQTDAGSNITLNAGLGGAEITIEESLDQVIIDADGAGNFELGVNASTDVVSINPDGSPAAGTSSELLVNAAANTITLDVDGDNTPTVAMNGTNVDIDADDDGTREVRISGNLTDIDTDLQVDADGTGTNNFVVNGSVVGIDAEGDGNLEALIDATTATLDVVTVIDADDDGNLEAEINATTADLDVILDVDSDDDGTNNFTVNGTGVSADGNDDGNTDLIVENANNGRVVAGDNIDEEQFRVDGVVTPPIGGTSPPVIWDAVIDGDLEVQGTLGLTGYTPGSVTFIGATGQLAEDNPNFFFDDANDALRLGGAAPAVAAGDQTLVVNGTPNAVVGNTLAGNANVWDVVVRGDQVTTGIHKFGASIWIDGVSATHAINANAPLDIETTAGNDIRLNANGGAAANSEIIVDGDGSQILFNPDGNGGPHEMNLNAGLDALFVNPDGAGPSEFFVRADLNLIFNDPDGDNDAEMLITPGAIDIDTELQVDADDDGAENLVVDGTTVDIDADDDGLLDLRVSGTLTEVRDDLDVDGNATLGDNAGADVHTINGTTTINETGNAITGALNINETDLGFGLQVSEADAGDGITIGESGTGAALTIFEFDAGNGINLTSNGAGNGLQVTANGGGNAIQVLTGDVDIDTDLNVDGNTTLNGDVDLGDAPGDAITLNGTLTGPGANHSLGTAAVDANVLSILGDPFNVGNYELFVDGDVQITGLLSLPGLTNNAVVFVDGAGNIATEASAGDFYWDATNNRLGIGNGGVAPTEALDVTGNIEATGTIQSGTSIIIDGTTPGSHNITATAGENLTLTPTGGTLFINGPVLNHGPGLFTVTPGAVTYNGPQMQMPGIFDVNPGIMQYFGPQMQMPGIFDVNPGSLDYLAGLFNVNPGTMTYNGPQMLMPGILDVNPGNLNYQVGLFTVSPGALIYNGPQMLMPGILDVNPGSLDYLAGLFNMNPGTMTYNGAQILMPGILDVNPTSLDFGSGAFSASAAGTVTATGPASTMGDGNGGTQLTVDGDGADNIGNGFELVVEGDAEVQGTLQANTLLLPGLDAGSVVYVDGTNSLATETGFDYDDGTNTMTSEVINVTDQYQVDGATYLWNGAGGGTQAVLVGNTGNTTNADANSTFVGGGAGSANTSGSRNTFVGQNTGFSNTTGFFNTFLGSQAGFNTVGGGNNVMIGVSTGFLSNGGANTFVGTESGGNNTGGGNNTLIGFRAEVGAGNLSNATAIGNLAQVDQSDALVLGSIAGVNGAGASTDVGIGTTTPSARLDVVGTTELNGALDATAAGNEIGDGTAVTQLTIEGVQDATGAETLPDPAFDLAVEGDIGATGIIKSGAGVWLDGVSATHNVTADQPLDVNTIGANDLSLSTNSTTAVTIDGTTQDASFNDNNIDNVNAISGTSTFGHLNVNALPADNGRVNLGNPTGNVHANAGIFPRFNQTYDIGTDTERWRQIFVNGNAGSGIHIGDAGGAPGSEMFLTYAGGTGGLNINGGGVEVSITTATTTVGNNLAVVGGIDAQSQIANSVGNVTIPDAVDVIGTFVVNDGGSDIFEVDVVSGTTIVGDGADAEHLEVNGVDGGTVEVDINGDADVSGTLTAGSFTAGGAAANSVVVTDGSGNFTTDAELNYNSGTNVMNFNSTGRITNIGTNGVSFQPDGDLNFGTTAAGPINMGTAGTSFQDDGDLDFQGVGRIVDIGTAGTSFQLDGDLDYQDVARPLNIGSGSTDFETDGGLTMGADIDVNGNDIVDGADGTVDVNDNMDVNGTLDVTGAVTLDNYSGGGNQSLYVDNTGAVQSSNATAAQNATGIYAGSVTIAAPNAGGTEVILDANVTAGSVIVYTRESAAGPQLSGHISARAAGASFTIQFSGPVAAGDVINYTIINP